MLSAEKIYKNIKKVRAANKEDLFTKAENTLGSMQKSGLLFTEFELEDKHMDHVPYLGEVLRDKGYRYCLIDRDGKGTSYAFRISVSYLEK